MARRKTHRGELQVPQRLIEPFIREFPGQFGPENLQLVFVLRALAQRLNDRSTSWLSEFGITAAQFNYLAAIYSFDKAGITVTELTSYLHTTNGSVVVMLNQLETLALIGRAPNPDDARSNIVSLTPIGRRLFKRSFVAYHRHVSGALCVLNTTQKEMLLGLLLHVGEALEDGPEDDEARASGSQAGRRGARVSLR